MREWIIPDFPEYKINEIGEVYSRYKFKTSIVTNEWRKVKPVLDKGIGYFLVTLVNAETKVRKNQFIHRLMCQGFIENPMNKPYVNHIDGNKQNNNLSNLEWATPRENSKHAVDTGLTTHLHCERKVLQYDINMNLLGEFKSLKEAYIVTGVAHQNISKVVRGLRKTAGNYIWVYK